jgi:glutamate-1-semialdehyde 2,1-aminomutase
MSIDQAYTRAFPRSKELAETARKLCPGGVSSASREMTPFPVYFRRAAGPRKWTVDGVEVVDFCMGHGSILFGHDHPAIRASVEEQLSRGTHLASTTEVELELAELVCDMVPSAERVRFAGTGSEAIHAALRLARAATGRERYLKFEGHYHGWHDHTLVALRPPYDVPPSAGIPEAARSQAVVLPPNDLVALEETLESRDDIACVIVEPAGGTHGTVPTSSTWVQGIRDLTTKHGVVLIFDEMVSGFRVAPGGYQELSGITPDLTTLGKALFGGFPGGALAGRADLMRLLEAGAVAHLGSWNGFPVSCAAGVAALRMAKDGVVQRAITELGESIRAGMNDLIEQKGIAARVYGSYSHIHFCLKRWPFSPDESVPPAGRHGELALDRTAYGLLRRAMLVNGVDVTFGNNLSAAHGDAEREAMLSAFDSALGMLVEDGALTVS